MKPTETRNIQNKAKQKITPSYSQAQLSEIANARAKRASDAALRDFFRQQGMEKTEIQIALKQYKKQRQQDHMELTTLHQQMMYAQRESLYAKIECKIILQAVTLGVNPDRIPYLLKLIDIESLMDVPLDEETLHLTLVQVICELPELLIQSNIPQFLKSAASYAQDVRDKHSAS